MTESTERMSNFALRSAEPVSHDPPGLKDRSDTRKLLVRTLIYAILGLVFCLTYLPPLSRGLELDETGSFWMAGRSISEAFSRAWHWPGQSVLFAGIQSAFTWGSGPWKEAVFRLPALAGALTALAFFYRLCRAVGANFVGGSSSSW